MAILSTSLSNSIFISILFLLSNVSNCVKVENSHKVGNETKPSEFEFPLNLEFMEAEFFLHGALGYGLDMVARELSEGGPPPTGARKAALDPLVHSIIYQFALIEVAHTRSMKHEVAKSFPRPPINLCFADFMNQAVGYPLNPPFDAYKNTLNFLLATYFMAQIRVAGAHGAYISGHFRTPETMKLVAGFLAADAHQDAVIRTLLYQRRLEEVRPYGINVEDFTNKISNFRNKIANAGMKDEGLWVDKAEGAEGKSSLNILSVNEYSGAYVRTREEVLRIMYGTGNESVVGGFFPSGCYGSFCKSLL